jgi:hypothetical protein
MCECKVRSTRTKEDFGFQKHRIGSTAEDKFSEGLSCKADSYHDFR